MPPIYTLSGPPTQIPAISLVGATGNAYNPPDAQDVWNNGFLRPAGAKAETVPRIYLNAATTATASGTLHLNAIGIPAGITISSISWLAAGATVTPTNQWFALFSDARARLAVTANDLTTAWAGNSIKTLALASAFTTTYSGLYYLGVLTTAATAPTLYTFSGSGLVASFAPVLWGDSTTGLTTTASCPATAAAPDGLGTVAYGYVS